MRIRSALLTLPLFFSATAALAEAKRYEIDASHTDIVWMCDHLGFSKSVGEFAASGGYLLLDEQKPEASQLEVTIETASVQTGDKKFDEHLKSKDFFNVEEFPRATFKSTAIELTGEKTAKVTGDFTLNGVTKPLTLDVTLNKIGTNPFSKKQTAGFSARANLYRAPYNITYGLPMVSDEVQLLIEAEATLVEQPAADEAKETPKAAKADNSAGKK